MSNTRSRYFRPKGISTTKVATTGDVDDYQIVQDARGSRGVLERRRGMVRLANFTTTATSADFDASNDDVDLTIDTRIFPLGTVFTLEMLFNTDTISSNRTVLGGVGATDAITVTHDTSEQVVVTIRDSAGTVTTVTFTGITTGTLCALQIVRDGASITCRLNGTTQTATMDASLSLLNAGYTVGSDNNSLFYDGKIDFIRIFNTARTSNVDGWCRLANPRAPDVMLDLILSPDSNGTCTDRSRYENHRAANGGLSTTTCIAVNPMPIQAIAPNTRRSGTRELIVVAGGLVYPVTVT